LVKPPPVNNALPEGFGIRNEFQGSCYVNLPENHLIISHGTTEFIVEGDHDRSGDLTVFLCKSASDYDSRPYVICHLHSLVEQFSVGIFISLPELELLETLPGTSYASSHAVFVNSFYSSGIVPALLLQKLMKQQMKNIVQSSEWYVLARNMCYSTTAIPFSTIRLFCIDLKKKIHVKQVDAVLLLKTRLNHYRFSIKNNILDLMHVLQ